MKFNTNNFNIKTPMVMGICNVTPDSFSDGGKNFVKKDALKNIHNMIKNGANIIDIGAESARPGSNPLSYNEEDFLDVIKSIGGVHVILDMVGGDYIGKNIKALVDDGRLVQIAFLQGPRVEINFAQIMTKRLTVTGSTLRPQSDFLKTKIASQLYEQIWPLLGNGRLKPIIFNTFELSDVTTAHLVMEKSEHIGKILLKVQK